MSEKMFGNLEIGCGECFAPVCAHVSRRHVHSVISNLPESEDVGPENNSLGVSVLASGVGEMVLIHQAKWSKDLWLRALCTCLRLTWAQMGAKHSPHATKENSTKNHNFNGFSIWHIQTEAKLIAEPEFAVQIIMKLRFQYEQTHSKFSDACN